MMDLVRHGDPRVKRAANPQAVPQGAVEELLRGLQAGNLLPIASPAPSGEGFAGGGSMAASAPRMQPNPWRPAKRRQEP